MRRSVALFTLCIIVALVLTFQTDNSRNSRNLFLSGEKELERSGAMEALDFWTRSRAYPYNDIPSDKYMKAYTYSKTKNKEVSRKISSGSIWDPIGPLNLQGRSNSVAINPQNHNTIYVGTASGGLWRSYTSGLGADWEQMKLGYPVLGISAIVIDPHDSNTIYLGTGEVYQYHAAYGGVVVRTTRGSYGIGILKTTDGGTTWTKSLDWSYNQQDGVQALKMNPDNPYTLWAATTQGILKTTDAGANWTNVYPILAVCTDIVVHSGDTNNVIAAIGNFASPPTTLIRTTDGGSNWDTLVGITSYSGKAMLATYAANPNIVYVSVGDSTTGVSALWRSTNFGDTWTKMSDYTTNGIFGVQGWYSHYVAVHPTDSSKVIQNSVGSSTSADGGVTFFYPPGNYADNHGYAIDPVDPNIFYSVNDDGIYRSTNFGQSYTSVGYGLQTGQFYNGFSNSYQDSMLAIVQSQDHIPGYFYRNNFNWERSVLDEAGWTAIDPTNDNIMYAVNRYGSNFYRSINRGTSFAQLAGFGGIGSWNSPFIIAPSITTTIYFGDIYIRKSTNRGMNWTITNGGTELDGNPALSIAMSFTNPDTVYVGFAPIVTNAHIYRTTNGGIEWTVISDSLPDRYPMDLAVDPTDSRVVYAAMGGFGSGHLFKSTDAGTNWANITGTLPDAPATAVVVDPLNSNIVYVGNDIGVYSSTNGGSAWSAFSDGLPDAVIVSDLIISPSNRTLRLSTHGNGGYERKMIGNFSPTVFDYKALAFNFPANGESHDAGVPISSVRASFRNSGTITTTDSFDVKYRILQGVTEVFSATKRLPPLASGETNVVTFDESYTPLDSATLTLEAITLQIDDSPSDDTLRGTLNVLLPSRINSWTISKSNCPYTEIVSGSPGPSGDDAQSVVALPFTFTYDGYPYDEVQISTNGWMEFGTGTAGTTRGLSTPSQLGGYFVQTISSKERPTKTIGPWWTDMSTGTTNPGVISYVTQGSSPNRLFIVQWKNVHAFFDETASTLRLNFQIHLFEGSDRIEIHYGPVVAGTFPPNATGAAMGLKDYVGGDYRYYDLARRSSGLASDVRTNLVPLVDWPGQDSCFTIQTTILGVPGSTSLPTAFSLHQNYPNPFNPSTVISYSLPVSSQVVLKVYDVLGREVQTLVNEKQQAGEYRKEFHAGSLPTGLYFYRIQTSGFVQTKKMLIMR